MGKFSVTKLPADIMIDLAAKHQFLRKQAGLTQSELAERSGVSLGSIKRFERTGQISLEFLLKSALILNRLDDFNPIFEVQDQLEKIEKLFSNKTRR